MIITAEKQAELKAIIGEIPTKYGIPLLNFFQSIEMEEKEKETKDKK